MHTGTEGSTQETFYAPQDEPLGRLAEAGGQIRPYWRAPKGLERDSGLNVRTVETAQHQIRIMCPATYDMPLFFLCY